MLSETAATAATLAPYALVSWQSLTSRTVQVAAPGRSAATLKVLKVTNLATASAMKMTGDVFSVGFQLPKALPAAIYTVTAPGLGTFPLFISGGTATAQALINRRVPA